MPFNISNFITQGLVYGGARPSLFDVSIFTPWNSTNSSKTQFLVSGTEIPPSVIRAFPQYYFGRAIKFAGERDFPDWTVEVLNDEDFALRTMFENWSNKINALVSNRQSPDVANVGYKSSASVVQYGQDGSSIASYDIQGIFPTVVSPIRLSWHQGNEIETYTVTFSLDFWEPGQSTNSNADNYSGIISPDGAAATYTK